MATEDPRFNHPLLLAAIENSANSIVITDIAGAVQWVNPAFSTLTGYSRAEIAGQNLRILNSGSHPKEFFEEMWRTILAGRPWRGQIHNRRKDRSQYVGEMTITPVCHDATAISHFIAVTQDITASYRAVQELRASSELMELALDASNQGMWDWNLVTGEYSLTQGFRRLLGYGDGESEFAGRDWFDLIHPDDRSAAQELLEKHLEGRTRQFEAEVRLRKNQGGYLRVLSRGHAINHDESACPARMVGVHFDISGRAKMEQQLRQAHRMETVGLLAGGIAHDFNNMLMVMNGYSELLVHSQLPEDTRELLGMIRSAGESAAALVRRLLAFTRHQAPEPKIVNLNGVVNELSGLLQRPRLRWSASCKARSIIPPTARSWPTSRTGTSFWSTSTQAPCGSFTVSCSSSMRGRADCCRWTCQHIAMATLSPAPTV